MQMCFRGFRGEKVGFEGGKLNELSSYRFDCFNFFLAFL